MTANNDAPAQPPFKAAHVVELVSIESSKIIGISLYASRAEVTRQFVVNVATGSNVINISGLPRVLEDETIRVQGHGDATIHDVTVAEMKAVPKLQTSDTLNTLAEERAKVLYAIERCKTSLDAVNSYLKSMQVQHIDVMQLSKVVSEYDATAEMLHLKTAGLEKQLALLDHKMSQEKDRLSGASDSGLLRKKVSINVFAKLGGEVELFLIYVVSNAQWKTGYDIRATMDMRDKPIALIYKAIITQTTGEDWNDVPLTLETATPSFGVGVPKLTPWTISIYTPPLTLRPSHMFHNAPITRQSSGLLPQDPEKDLAFLGFTFKPHSKTMDQGVMDASSSGNITATFRVPGTVTIPSNPATRNLTIAELALNATMTWVCVPKQDTKVHLQAKIHNDSDYELLAGQANVYVNGSFIARTMLSNVSPQETFDCSLGVDPSIRVTYHPRTKKLSESGFYNKSSSYTYAQRIDIHNSKTVSIDRLKIQDQVPVSEDAIITVKLVQPALQVVAPSSSSWPTHSAVKVGEGIVAQWDGVDEPEKDANEVGNDGKINWVCLVPAQGRVNLVLSWEVTCPSGSQLVGL